MRPRGDSGQGVLIRSLWFGTSRRPIDKAKAIHICSRVSVECRETTRGPHGKRHFTRSSRSLHVHHFLSCLMLRLPVVKPYSRCALLSQVYMLYSPTHWVPSLERPLWSATHCNASLSAPTLSGCARRFSHATASYSSREDLWPLLNVLRRDGSPSKALRGDCAISSCGVEVGWSVAPSFSVSEHSGSGSRAFLPWDCHRARRDSVHCSYEVCARRTAA